MPRRPHFLGATGARSVRQRIASVLGIILLPLVIASGFLWATSGSDSRLHRSEAAIVNLDEGARLDGRPVHLGQDYALDLRNQQGPNFTWRYGVSVTDAQDGLASGRYSAAVVIPAAFSRVLTGTASGTDADRATLVVERSPLSGVSDQVVFGQLSSAATHALGSEVARKYLDKVFVSSTELGQALWQTSALAQEASNASKELTSQAQQAQRASTDLAERATTTTTTGKDVADATGKAATSAKDVGTSTSAVRSSVTTTTTGNAARDKAIADVAGKATSVSEAAGKASATTAAAAKQATAAGRQGSATQGSADAVAKAAAANKAAAADYSSKVAAVVKQQQDLSARLADSSKALDGYVGGTTAAAATVQATVAKLKTITAASVPNRPYARPGGREPGDPAEGDAAALTASQLTAMAVSLRSQAEAMRQAAPSTGVDLSKEAQALLDATKSLQDQATVLSSSNQKVRQAVAGAKASLATTTSGYEDVVKAMSEPREVTVRGTVRVTSVGVKVPEAPSCPSDYTAVQCKRWRKEFRDYQARVVAANAIRESNFPVSLTQKVTATPDAAALEAARTSAQQATTQLDAADQAAITSDKQATGIATAAADIAATVQSAFSAQADAVTKQLAAANATYQASADVLTALATQLDELSTHVSTSQQVQQQVASALADPVLDSGLKALDQAGQQGVALSTQSHALVQAAQANARTMGTVGQGSDAVKKLDAGATGVGTTAAAQLEVVKKLQDTLTALNTGMGTLGQAMTGLSSQATSLSQDTAKVSDNATATASQVASLTRTIDQLTGTVQRASSDATTASQRAAALQQQISALQQASTTVSASTTTVTTTAGAQQERASLLAKSTRANQAKAPTYDDASRQRLTDVVSQPISTVQQNAFRNVGWVSMLMLLALWAGAMGLHSVFAPVSAAARRSTASPERLLATEMTPAVMISLLQALAVAAVGQAALHMTAPRLIAVTFALMLSAVCFAAVNHALVAFLRVYGRLVAVVFALVTGATLVTTAYPDAMGTLRTLSPITPALDVVRSLMTGAPGGRGSFFLLLGWLAIGALFSGLAILRARNPEPVRVPSIHEDRVTPTQS